MDMIQRLSHHVQSLTSLSAEQCLDTSTCSQLETKQLFGTVTLSAILGVTEPAIYGVFVKFRRPFIAVMIGGGLGDCSPV